MEQAIDQIQQVGSSFLDTAQQIFQAVAGALKPGIDAAAPIVQQAGQEALKAASPVISEASKKAQEAMMSSGIDTESVVAAAKVLSHLQILTKLNLIVGPYNGINMLLFFAPLC